MIWLRPIPRSGIVHGRLEDFVEFCDGVPPRDPAKVPASIVDIVWVRNEAAPAANSAHTAPQRREEHVVSETGPVLNRELGRSRPTHQAAELLALMGLQTFRPA